MLNYVKIGQSPSPQNVFCLLQRKPCKNDENVFYFILKALLVLRIFKCLP